MKRTLRRRGFTLMELTIVLLVAGVIVGAVWSAAQKVWDNYRVYRLNQQLLTTVQNIRDYYLNCQQLPPGPCTGAAAAGADITATLDGLNLFPQEMRRNPATPGATPIDHAFNNALAGGSFHVTSLAVGGGLLSRFRVSVQSLTQGPCIRLLMLQPLTDAGIGIVRVGTQSGSTIIDDLGNAAITLPINAATAAGWCASAGDANRVDWDFKLRN